MREKLIKSINDIRILLTNNYDEAKIKQTVILRLLSELGWNFFDVNEVIPEYTVGSKRVDYCLKIGDKIKVFIEAKNSRHELTNHQNQLLEYSFQEGIELSILTNGSIWWFYLPLQSGHWTKRRFITLDIKNQDVEFIVANFIKYLAKENIKNSSAYDNALIQLQSNDASESIQDILIKTWNKLVIETDALLVTLIQNKAHELYLQKPNNNVVCDFLDKNKIDLILQENYSSRQPNKPQLV